MDRHPGAGHPDQPPPPPVRRGPGARHRERPSPRPSSASPHREPHPGVVLPSPRLRATPAPRGPRPRRPPASVESLRFAGPRRRRRRALHDAAAVGRSAPAAASSWSRPGASAAALAPLPLGLLPLTPEDRPGAAPPRPALPGAISRGCTGGRSRGARDARGAAPPPRARASTDAALRLRAARAARRGAPARAAVATLGELDLGLERIAEAGPLRLQGRGAGATHVNVVVTPRPRPRAPPSCSAPPAPSPRRGRCATSCAPWLVGRPRGAGHRPRGGGRRGGAGQAGEPRSVAHRRERAGHELDLCLARLRAFLGEPPCTASGSPTPTAGGDGSGSPSPGRPRTARRGRATSSRRRGALRLLDPPVPRGPRRGAPR